MNSLNQDKSEHIQNIQLLTIMGIVALVTCITHVFFTPVVVDGASMQPTLEDHDQLLVTNIGEPERFDIVVFHATEKKDYIKRIIGLPGDHIAYKNDVLYINGEAYKEPYLAKHKQKIKNGVLTSDFELQNTAVNSYTVPKGHVFVLGDNRRISNDSRYIGAIPIDNIVGTYLFSY